MAPTSGSIPYATQRPSNNEIGSDNTGNNGKLRQPKSSNGGKASMRHFSRSTAVPTHRQFGRTSGPMPNASNDPDIYEADSFSGEQSARRVPSSASVVQTQRNSRQRRVVEVRINSRDERASLFQPRPSSREISKGDEDRELYHSKEVGSSSGLSKGKSRKRRLPASSMTDDRESRAKKRREANVSDSGAASGDDEIEVQQAQAQAQLLSENERQNRSKRSKRPKVTASKNESALFVEDYAKTGNGLDARDHDLGQTSMLTSNQHRRALDIAEQSRERSTDLEQPDDRSGSEESEEAESGDDADDADDPERSRTTPCDLFGQRKKLAKVWNTMKDSGLDGNDHTRYKPAREIKQLCADAMTAFNELRQGLTVGIDEHGKPAEVERIKDIVSKLCRPNDDDAKDSAVIFAMYQIVIPSLTNLYTTSIKCFEELDKNEEAPEDPFTTNHLRVITLLISFAVRVGHALKTRYKDKAQAVQDTNLIHNNFTMTLREVHRAFEARIRQHDEARARELATQAQEAARQSRLESRRREDAQHEATRREEHARQAARWTREWEREQLAATHRREIRTLQTQWRALHHLRLWAERLSRVPAHMRDAKRRHLDIVDARDVVETDWNGEQFRREEFFTVRVGPPFAMIERARQDVWSDAEATALYEGLRDDAGPEVLERIMTAHCGAGEVLNQYNVTQIVVTAARLKYELLEARRRTGALVEDWIDMIPDWTKPFALGKENDEGGE